MVDVDFMQMITETGPALGIISLLILGFILFGKLILPSVQAHEMEKLKLEHEAKRRDDEMMLKMTESMQATTTILADIKNKVDVSTSTLGLMEAKGRDYDSYRAELHATVKLLSDQIGNMKHTICAPETHKLLNEILKDIREALTILKER